VVFGHGGGAAGPGCWEPLLDGVWEVVAAEALSS
jgi:hypothetical protein